MTDEIDQDVREAALTFGGWDSAQAVLDGRADRHKIVQALARMKAAGREQGLREAAEIFHNAASSTRIDADAGLWEGIEDEVQGAIDTFNGHAESIEALLSEKPA